MSLKTSCCKLEIARQRTAEEKSEQERRQRRASQKVTYEKTQLENEIQALNQQERDLESAIKDAISYQEKAQDNLDRIQTGC